LSREIELTVEFERAGLNGERSRGRSRFRGLVQDSHLGAKLCQPQGQDEAGWARADYQNVAVRHTRLIALLGRHALVAQPQRRSLHQLRMAIFCSPVLSNCRVEAPLGGGTPTKAKRSLQNLDDRFIGFAPDRECQRSMSPEVSGSVLARLRPRPSAPARRSGSAIGLSCIWKHSCFR
jgi:hypothetical protein